MLTINHLILQYGGKQLFRDVSARISGRERIGLVGVNGAGKSTLLRIMSGEVESDDGVIIRSRHTTIGYLPQEAVSSVAGRTLYEEAETAFSSTLSLQKALDDMNRELAVLDQGSPEFTELLGLQGKIQERLEQADVFRIRARIEKVLAGLGFQEADFGRDCLSFSGGWLMRLMLAKLLLAEPSLLLLDEPTNHLDLDTVMWLEDFIRSYKGALVIISHDRSFLDNVTSLTWELAHGNLVVYKGNYSAYMAEKQSRLEVLRAAHANQQATIRETMRFVERFRAKSTKARQVRSRVRRIEKMELVELDPTDREISFSFPPAAAGGRMAITAQGLSKSYGGKPVLSAISFELRRGDKMAVVGPNGAGKSTLLRLLAGIERPDGGEIIPGHNLRISYFAQHQARDLDPALTVLETLEEIPANDMTTTRMRSLLGAFLFCGDDVEKKVRVLSGGEKNRLALARMIATPANLLLMDEPTNHLDMVSQEILQEALRRYDGSIIIVSHNRYFLDRFVGRVLEVRTGGASLFEGNMSDYLARSADSGGPARPEGRRSPSSSGTCGDGASGAWDKKARQAQALLRQEKGRRLSPLRKEAAETENEIASMEDRKAEIERSLGDPGLYRDKNALSGINREYLEIRARLEELYRRWEVLQGKIEEIEAAFSGGG